jgi:Flp pilus assembly protein TadD
MLPFDSASADLSRKVSDHLRGLKGSARTKLIVVPFSQTVSQHVDTTEKARTLFRATHVLHGSLENKDGRVILRAYLTDARSHVATKQWRADYLPGEERYIPVALAGMVTGAFRLPALTAMADVRAAAQQEYKNGLVYVRYDTRADSALAAMQKAVTADPDSPLTHAGLAEACLLKYSVTKDRKYMDLADQSLREAQRRNGDLAPVHKVAGILLANKGFYEQAAYEQLRSIELSPASSDPHRRLGQAYGAVGQHEQALAELRRAVELDPDYHRNYGSLGHYYEQRADYKQAVYYFTKAVELAPKEPATHFALAAVYMDWGRFSDAERQLREALVLGETSTVLSTLGMVLMYQGRDQEALVYIQRAAQIVPEDYVSWMMLGIAYRRLNLIRDSERANQAGLALAEAAMKANPHKTHARACTAYLYARLGDRRRADTEIAQALQAAPNDVDTRFIAVSTLEAIGRREETIALLESSPPALVADVSRFPDLADLAKDPRFIRIMRSQTGQSKGE